MARDVQIGTQGALVLSDQIGLVRGGAEEAVYVLIGVDGNGLEAQVVTGPEDPHGDLAPVGDQDLLECLAHISFLLLSAGCNGFQPGFVNFIPPSYFEPG